MIMYISFLMGYLIAVSFGKLRLYFNKQTVFNKGFEAGVEQAATLFPMMEFKISRAINKDGLYIQGFLNNIPCDNEK